MKKIICSIITIVLMVFAFIPTSKAKETPLDYIESFDIKVTTNSDATLNFDYEIKWRVLNDTKEGPLKDVRIGTPNSHVDNIKIISNDTISFYNKYNVDGDTGIRLILDREYYANEVVDLHFSFHQTHMFTMKKDKENNTELVTYKYIPCWFDEIKIGRLTVYWDNSNNDVYYNDCKKVDGANLVWEAYSLNAGEKTSISVSYDKKVFPNINEKEHYEKDETGKIVAVIWIIILVTVFVIAILSRIFRRASYYRTRGFFPAGRMFFTRSYYYGVNNKGERKINPYISSGGAGHSSHSCACACACACAGGGRAGCSKKDFYKGKIEIDDLINKL